MSRQKQTSASTLTDDPSIQPTRIPTPPLCFSDTAQTLEDLVKSQPPHCVIRCVNLPSHSNHAVNSNVDISQPLLAYTTRKVRMVSAHSLVFDNQRHEYDTIGNGLLIPENYPGWFAVMGTPDTEIKPHRYYTKLSLLAISGCSHFLIGGKDPIRGVMVQHDERGSWKTTPCSVLPGTVLRKAGLYREEKKARKNKKKKKKDVDLPLREYLKCFDEHDREMLVHIRQTGLFYIVSKSEVPVFPTVLQMKDILRYKFPLVVKLVYGRVPTTPCAFTQVLLLTDRGFSQTLIASTLLCYRNINVEIPLGTDLKFVVARNTVELLSSEAYIRALQMCKEQAPSYIKDIKVVFGNSQLVSDEVTRFNGKTSQKETQTHSNQPLPDCKLPEATQNFPAWNEIPVLHRGRISVSTISKMSVLSQMSDHVVISDATFVMTDQPPSPRIKTCSIEDPTTMALDTNHKMAAITGYDPPKRDQIDIKLFPGQLSRPECEERAQGDRMYDNNSGTGRGNSCRKTENTTAKSGSSSCLPSTLAEASLNQNYSDIYYCAFDAKRTSTIDIPSKVGQPVSPGKSPLGDRKQFEYISMHSKVVTPLPKPHHPLQNRAALPPTPEPPHTQASLHNRAALPPTPEAPQIPPRARLPRTQYQYSESSSTNDSDSLTSLSEDSWSLSEWTTDEECIYINMNLTELKRVENPVAGNDHYQQFMEPGDSSPYLVLENVPEPNDGNTVPYSKLESNFHMDLTNETGGYLQPIHVDYQTSLQTQERRASDPGYSKPDERPDSGVYDDEPGYTMVQELLDASNTEHQANDSPTLPPLMSLGQALIRSVPTTSKFAFTQLNKDMLVSELRKDGIKPATECALAGLEFADIVNILSKDDEFDDDLLALLPEIGKVDFRKIVLCLKKLKLSINR